MGRSRRIRRVLEPAAYAGCLCDVRDHVLFSAWRIAILRPVSETRDSLAMRNITVRNISLSQAQICSLELRLGIDEVPHQLLKVPHPLHRRWRHWVLILHSPRIP